MTLIASLLYGFFLGFYLLICALLVLLILIQKGKSSMGLGSMGGGSQILFGGSGGQDFLQKTTWVLGFIFIFGSLTLSIIQSNTSKDSRYISALHESVLPVVDRDSTANPPANNLQ